MWSPSKGRWYPAQKLGETLRAKRETDHFAAAAASSSLPAGRSTKLCIGRVSAGCFSTIGLEAMAGLVLAHPRDECRNENLNCQTRVATTGIVHCVEPLLLEHWRDVVWPASWDRDRVQSSMTGKDGPASGRMTGCRWAITRMGLFLLVPPMTGWEGENCGGREKSF